MTKKELAQSICNLVGESNIRTIANCYTRVRLTVKDPEKMRREELKKLEGVLGVIEEGSHVQLVLGPGTVTVGAVQGAVFQPQEPWPGASSKD